MSVATTYAKTLYSLAAEGKTPAEVAKACAKLESQMDAVLTALHSSSLIKAALYGPVVTAKEKAKVISELAQKAGLEKLLAQFLTLLANKGRLPVLDEIRAEFSSVRLQAEGGVAGRLVSAEPMNDADVETLAKAFSKKLGKKVAFQLSVDPSLLAGVKVTVSGVTYDGTIRAQLQQLRDRVLVGPAG